MYTFKQRDEIRRLYKELTPKIIETSERNPGMWIDPYFYNWNFTPIERLVWSTLRYYGLPLYPEYPAGKYFLDFGNPFFKVGLEADGKEWHNKKKDTIRDGELYKLGWTIYRVTGAESYMEVPSETYDMPNYYNNPDYIEKVRNTSDGVVMAILNNYVFEPRNLETPMEWSEVLSDHCLL